MAVVKNPLHSASASGSIANALCFSPVGDTRPRTIHREVEGLPVDAQYPARIMSGRGIVRLKPQYRGDLRKPLPAGAGKENRQQQLREDRFTAAATISRWIVRNNLVPSVLAPALLDPTPRPWSAGVYLRRTENRELRKFPGQEIGETLSVRRRVAAPTTEQGFVMHQLLSRRYFRFEITLAAFLNLPQEQISTWVPGGDAPWSELPQFFSFGGDLNVPRVFVNCWIQAAYFIPLFALPKEWLIVGQRAEVWRSPVVVDSDDPDVIEWRNYWSAQSDYVLTQSHDWR